MNSTISRSSNQLPVSMSPMVRAAMWTAGIVFAVFGLFTVEYASAIVNGTHPLLLSVIESISNYAPGSEPGLKTLEEQHAHYRDLMVAISPHAFLGGFVVILGTLQFVPSLRRNYRQLHRGLGALLALLMTAVSITGLYFLFYTPPDKIFAGQAFFFTLFGVASLSLGLLLQSGLAIMARDFRSHMVWMGLTFCCFLTAPLLRLNYLVVANLDVQVLSRVVQNSSPTVQLQAYVLFMLWFLAVGDKDLPLRNRQPLASIPAVWLKFLTWFSVAGVVGLLGVLLLADVSAYFNWTPEVAGAGLLVLALLKVMQLFAGQRAWEEGMNGGKPTGLFAVATVLSAIAMLVLASGMNTSGFNSHALFYCLVHLALLELIVLGISFVSAPLGTGAHLFTLASVSTCWMWAGVLPVLGLVLLTGMAFDVSLIAAFVLVPAISMAIGIVVATGAVFRLGLRTESVTNRQVT